MHLLQLNSERTWRVICWALELNALEMRCSRIEVYPGRGIIIIFFWKTCWILLWCILVTYQRVLILNTICIWYQCRRANSVSMHQSWLLMNVNEWVCFPCCCKKSHSTKYSSYFMFTIWGRQSAVAMYDIMNDDPGIKVSQENRLIFYFSSGKQ